MPTGFQQQKPVQNFGFSKPVSTPQHGQQTDRKPTKVKEPRSFQPRPQQH